jgi:hypothetical protein
MEFQGCGKSRIANNSFKNMATSVHVKNGAQFLSFGRNIHELISGTQLIQIDGALNSFIWSHFEQQDYIGARSVTTGIPFTANPIDNIVNHGDRTLFARPVATWFMQSGAAAVGNVGAGFTDLQVEYQDGTAGLLTIDGSFAGQYSRFNAGETQIHPSVVTGAWTVGKYVWINGTVPTLYLIFSAIGGGIFTIRPPLLLAMTGASVVMGSISGNLTSNFLGASGTYNTTFDDGGGNYETHAVTYTNGSVAVTWVGALARLNKTNVYTAAIPGNWTGNFTGAHPCTEYYAAYQVDQLV